MASAETTVAMTRAGPVFGPGYEPLFWSRTNAVWRQLAGSLPRQGFSFEWQELQPGVTLNWAHSFHPSSVEICLNLQGSAWVASRSARLELGPESVVFFVLSGGHLKAQRLAGQHHQFLSVDTPSPSSGTTWRRTRPNCIR